MPASFTRENLDRIAFNNEETEEEEEIERKARRKRCLFKAIKITGIVLICLVVFLLIALFVVFPLVFKDNIALQRFVVFFNIQSPSDPEFGNFEKYNISGVRNLYVTVNRNYSTSLGVWHILPQALVNDSLTQEDFDFEATLANTSYDVIVFLHGVGANRIAYVNMYQVLRESFQIIAFDYRDYGDSTEATLSESAVVDETANMFKWVRKKTQSKIYFWGHSLGAAIGVHAVALLKQENIIPFGLVLEAPFTNLRDEIRLHPFGKVFAWLPWFHGTVLDPLKKNGFLFESDKNILLVDSPIMILHAEDDNMIPFHLGKKLADVARTRRNLTIQGNVTFHRFDASLEYGHLWIYEDEYLPDYIIDFREVCNAYNFGKG